MCEVFRTGPGTPWDLTARQLLKCPTGSYYHSDGYSRRQASALSAPPPLQQLHYVVDEGHGKPCLGGRTRNQADVTYSRAFKSQAGHFRSERSGGSDKARGSPRH